MNSALAFLPLALPHPKERATTVKTTREQLENRAYSLLQSCTTFKQLTQIHAYIVRNTIHENNFVATKFVSRCFSSNNPLYALRVFNHIPRPNSFLWNNMIKGLADAGSYQEACMYYLKMLNYGSEPNNFTFPFVLKACSKLTAFEEGRVVHGQVLKLGLSSDVYIQTSLLDFYGSCREIMYARNVFDRMSQRDVVAWNAILASYVRCGQVDVATELFEEMPIRNVSSWTTMIGGFVQSENSKEAVEFFRRMQIDGVEPDNMTITTILSAVADLGLLDMGRWIHNYMKSNKIELDAFSGAALIDMYSKCGSIQEAQNVFNGVSMKNISCYNTMISGFAVHGYDREAIALFKQAEMLGVGIDDVNMIALLNACSHSGLVDVGYRYFNSMKRDYGIEPKMEHYGCMLDLLGRSGRFDEAMKLIELVEPDVVLLATLAFACRIHGNVELGEELANKMSILDPTNSGVLVLKSNLFAAEGKWEEAADVRRLMKDKGIDKIPGSSWIEVNNVVHEFVAGDNSHPSTKAIYKKLAELRQQMSLLMPTAKRR